MTKPFKPMLAGDISEALDKIQYPIYATPKLDGVRALLFADGVFSRSMKRIPNIHVQRAFAGPNWHCADGELIVGEPTDDDVYRKTNSVTASADDDTPVRFFAFDLFAPAALPFKERIARIPEFKGPMFQRVPVIPVENPYQLLKVEEKYLDQGYEGLILRSPEGTYKNGRSTIKEQGMLKLKRFTDSEAEVLGIEEEMHNANEAKTNELGQTARSSHKANLVGKGTMGALTVRDLVTGVTFRIGTGFTGADRARTDWVGKIVKYKSFLVGVKDKPRHPVFLGVREKFDL